MKFLSIQNLSAAYKNALKSRKRKKEVYDFNINLEKNLISILDDLKHKTYQHGLYTQFILSDSKKRYIYSPNFRDHILHYMIYNICYGVLDKKIIFNSFATRKGKGTHKGIFYFLEKLKKYKFESDNLYYMKIDISKYFYSISHDFLKQKIFKHIHNSDLQFAINIVIDSYQTSSIFDNLFDESSFYRKTKNKGLPIGALYSQLLANFFLYDIDHYILQNLKPKIYLRYMDDFIFVDTKQNLKYIQSYLLQKLDENGLFVVKTKIQLNLLSHGINLLGFRVILADKKIQFHVTKTNKKKYRKLIENIYKYSLDILEPNDIDRLQSILESRKGLFKHTGNYRPYLGKNALKLKNQIILIKNSKLLLDVLNA
ncbi:MAG: reverse transcriptase domain-containing protein [Candidatus Absconditabacterales bacterium]